MKLSFKSSLWLFIRGSGMVALLSTLFFMLIPNAHADEKAHVYKEIRLPVHRPYIAMNEPEPAPVGPFADMRMRVRMSEENPDQPWQPGSYKEAAREMINMLPEEYLNYLLFRYGYPREVANYWGKILSDKESRELDVSAFIRKIWPIDDDNTQFGQEFKCMGSFELTYTAFYYEVASVLINRDDTGKKYDKWMLEQYEKEERGETLDLSEQYHPGYSGDAAVLYQILRSHCIPES